MKKLQTLLLLLGISLLSANAAVIASGDCGASGANAQWTWDDASKTLAITGTGAMATYNKTLDRPWNAYASEIENVTVSGVSSIGSIAFQQFYNLNSVTISDVKTIGASAFFECTSLSSITLPASVTAIGESAFRATALTSISLPSNLSSIAANAFTGCSSLTEIEMPTSLKSIGAEAFKDCSALSRIVISNSTVPSVQSNTFDGVTLAGITLELTNCSYVSSFSASSPWSEMKLQGPAAKKLTVRSAALATGSVAPEYSADDITCGEKVTVEAVPETGYHFKQWSDNNTDNPRTILVANNNITLSASFEINSYTVTFMANGTTLSKPSVNHGATVPTNTVNSAKNSANTTSIAPTGNEFDYWESSVSGISVTDPITEPVTFTAVYKPKTYTITFNGNGGTISGVATKTVSLEFGSTISAADVPADADMVRANYDFDGWNTTPEGTTVNGAMTFTAQWTLKKYNVQFYDPIADAYYPTVFQVEHGKTVSSVVGTEISTIRTQFNHPEAGKQWTGWSPAITAAVTGDVTIEAQYTDIKYTVIYKNDNSASATAYRTLSNLAFGADATLPSDQHPTKTGKVFQYWEVQGTGDLTNVTTDMEVWPVWDDAYYTVNFYADAAHSKFISSDYVKYGTAATAPTTAEVYAILDPAAVVFNGTWSNTSYTRVTGDLDVHAITTPRTYTVTYLDAAGGTFRTLTAKYGDAVQNIALPTQRGYNYTAWDGIGNIVTSDTYIYPIYSLEQYTITINVNNTEWGTVDGAGQYDYKSTAYLYAWENEGYTFLRWSNSSTDNPLVISSVESNQTLTAYFTPKSHTVTFFYSDNSDNNVYNYKQQKTVTVLHGYDVSANDLGQVELLVRQNAPEGYKFTGWSAPTTNIIGDAVLNAQYQIQEYTVTFNSEGATPYDLTKPYGEYVYDWEIQNIVNPYFQTYQPVGTQFPPSWSPDPTLSPIKGNLTTAAKWAKEQLTVYFVDDQDASWTYTASVDYGERVAVPDPQDHSDKGLKFTGWEYADGTTFNRETPITTNYLTIHATYNDKIDCIVFFHSDETNNSSVFKEETVKYGETVDLSNYQFPGKEGYEITHWTTADNSQTYELNGTVTVYAALHLYPVLEEKEYIITFYDHNQADPKVIKQVVVKKGGDIDEPTTAQINTHYTTYYPNLEFVQWASQDYLNPATKDLNIYAEARSKTCNVQFLDCDGNLYKEFVVNYGEKVAAPQLPSDQTQYATAWYPDPTVTAITQDGFIFSPDKCDPQSYVIALVTEYGERGTLTGAGTYPYGKDDVYIKAEAAEGYTFTGWKDGNQESFRRITVTGNETYEAIFDVQYVPVYFTYQGTLLDDAQVQYGKTLINAQLEKAKKAAVDNAPAGMKFVGWIDAVDQEIKAETTIEASYEDILYKVIFRNGEAQVGEAEVVHDSKFAVVAAPQVEKTGYDFQGWKHGNTLVNAETVIDEEQFVLEADWKIKTYQIRFIDGFTGARLDTYSVEHGGDLTAHKDSWVDHTAVGQEFVGWSKSLQGIDSDEDITALYTPILYKVQFHADDDLTSNVIATEEVLFNQNVTSFPTNPQKVGFIFDGWTDEWKNVTADVDVLPKWKKQPVQVTFYDENDSRIDIIDAYYGDQVTPNAYTPDYGFVFKQWVNKTTRATVDFSTLTLTGDLDVQVVLERAKYKVTFINCDGQQIGQVQEVEYEGQATAPTAPKIAGQVWKGWSKDFSYITEDLIVESQCETEQFTVTFLDDENNLIGTPQTVDYLGSATAPTAAALKAWYAQNDKYEFDYWDSYEFKQNVTSDLNIKAVVKLKQFQVTFQDCDGKVLGTELVEWGGLAQNVPTLPDVTGKTQEWDANPYTTQIIKITVFTSTCQNNEYRLTVISEDTEKGTVAGTGIYEFGDDATISATATENYEFLQWNDGDTQNPRVVTVSANATHIAQFKAKVHYVNFYANQQNVYIAEVAHNGMVGQTDLYNAQVEAEKKAEVGKIFDAWTDAATILSNPITKNEQVEAIWKDIEYHVIFMEGNTIYADITVPMNKSIVGAGKFAEYPQDPEKVHYSFVGWTHNGTAFNESTPITEEYFYVTPEWDIDKFTVTFLDQVWGQQIRKDENVPYGTQYGVDKDNPTAADVPDRSSVGKVFTGNWYGPSVITANTSITALYTDIQCAIRFHISEDASSMVFATKTVAWGTDLDDTQVPVLTTLPEGKVFDKWVSSWTGNYLNVKEDRDIYPTFKAEKFTITFVDHLLNEIPGTAIEVEYGNDATAPQAEVEYYYQNNYPEYKFTGSWRNEADMLNVTSDRTIQAKPELTTRTVTFFDCSNQVIKTIEVVYGGTIPTDEIPDYPQQEGKTVSSWSVSDIANLPITTNLTVKAVCDDDIYTITAVPNNDLWGTVNGGGEKSYNQYVTLTATANTGYNFENWTWSEGTSTNRTIGFNATKSDVYTAIFSVQQLTVQFVDPYTNNELHSVVVNYGEKVPENEINIAKAAAIANAPATQYFSSWDNEAALNDVVTSDLTIKPVYKDIEYTVYFMDGTDTRYTLSVPMDKSLRQAGLQLPTLANKEHYNFAGWLHDDATFNAQTVIDEDQFVVVADWTKKQYAVHFIDDVTRTEFTSPVMVEYQTNFSAYPTAPDHTNIGRQFKGWDDANAYIVGETYLTAQYDYIPYYVYFHVGDDESSSYIQRETVYGGSIAQNELPAGPAKDGYEFWQWSDAYNNVTKTPTHVYPLWTPKKCTISFVDHAYQNIIQPRTVDYGESATALLPSDAVVKSYYNKYPEYEFTGWKNAEALQNITTDVTIFADVELKTYKVVFYGCSQADNLGAVDVKYGEFIPTDKIPALPTIDGKKVTNWSQNPYTLKVTESLNIYAQCQDEQYVISVKANDDTYGTVTGSNTYLYGEQATMQALPETGYSFDHWEPGYSTDNPLTISVTKSAVYTAIFKPAVHTIHFQYQGQDFHTTTVEHNQYLTESQITVAENKAQEQSPLNEEFIGWSDARALTLAITSDLSVEANYSSVSYQVNFLSEGELVGTLKVPANTTIYAAGQLSNVPQPSRDHYDFAGWQHGSADFDPLTTVIDEAQYFVTAKWNLAKYTVHYYQDATTPAAEFSKEDDVEFGTVVTLPTPPDYTSVGKEFSGRWSGSTRITGETVLTALYNDIQYEVRFHYDDDPNSAYETRYATYGNPVTSIPQDPTKEGKVFLYWEGNFSQVTADTDIYPKWGVEQCTVHFLDHEGNQIGLDVVVDYGESAESLKPSDAVVINYYKTNYPQYEFKGWKNESDLQSVTKANLIVTAEVEFMKYPVVFYDCSTPAKTLKTLTVNYGETVAEDDIPEYPTVEGQQVLGWDKDPKTYQIVGPTSFRALCNPESYVISVKANTSAWGYTNGAGTFSYNDPVSLSAMPYLGYDFDHWEPGFSTENPLKFNATETVEYTAVFKVQELTVHFQYNGQDFYAITVNYNAVLSQSQLSQAESAAMQNAPTGEKFAGWYDDSKLKANITQDLYVEVKYESQTYTVFFTDGQGANLKKFEAPLNKTLVESGLIDEVPADPTRTNYNFAGWAHNGQEFNKYTAKIDEDPYLVTAVWTPVQYEVQYLDGVTGDAIRTIMVDYGAAVPEYDATVLPDHTGIGRIFEGNWSPNFYLPVSGNTTVIAQYGYIEYEVRFHKDTDPQSEIHKLVTVHYGEGVLDIPVFPTKIGMICTDWVGNYTNVTDPAGEDIYPYWELATYRIRFYDYDKTTVLDDQQGVEYGSTIVAPEYEETRTPGYQLKEWRNLITNRIVDFRLLTASEDLDVYAVLEKATYEVRFFDCQGTQLGATQYVKYEESARAPQFAPAAGDNFDGWDKDYTKITESVDIYALCSPKVFKVRFVDEDGTTDIVAEQDVIYGNAAVEPTPAMLAKEGKTFSGWLPAISTENITSDVTFVATYRVNVYTVRFLDHDGATLVGPVQQIEHGKAATKPADPIWANHIFVDWEPNNPYSTLGNIVCNTDFTAQYDKVKHHVEFLVDGVTYYETWVSHEDPSDLPLDPEKPGFDFTGWDADLSKIVAPVTTNANFVRKQYTVSFFDYDDEWLTDIQVYHDSTIYYRPQENKRPCYQFTGWSTDVETQGVKSNMSVKALYEQKQYSVVFVNTVTGDTIGYPQVQTVLCGEDAVAPADPVEYGYTFLGWKQDYTNVIEDIVVEADFQRVKFTVYFVDRDGYYVGDPQEVEFESTAESVAPTAPAVTGYTFVTWLNDNNPDQDITTPITGPTVFRATYEINKYLIRFLDHDDSVIDSMFVEYNNNYDPMPADPVREGYTFKGWDKADYIAVQADADIKAVYEINKYQVTFRDDYKVLSTDIYEYGSAAVAPAPEDVTPIVGYHFSKWSRDSVDWLFVKEDLIIKAVYAIDTFAVRFLDNDGELIGDEQIVNYGGAAVEPTIDEIPYIEGKHFDHWSTYEFNYVAQDLEVKAIYDFDIHSVQFFYIDKDDIKQVIDEQMIQWGQPAEEPSQKKTDPDGGLNFDVNTKVFIGWSDSIFMTEVKEDLQIEALYVDKWYNVKFWDSFNKPKTLIKDTIVEYKHEAYEPILAADLHYGYHFTGWSDSIFMTSVEANLDIDALWDINVYTVLFLDWNDETIDEQQVVHGYYATSPNDPVREGYTFTGWDQTYDVVVSDMTIRPVFEINKYTVTFKNWDGQVLKVQTGVEWNTAAEAPITEPERGQDYIFTGWDTDFSHVQSDLTVVATFSGRYYLVTFEDYDGSILRTSKTQYGQPAVAPEDPVRPGHKFTGWDTDFSKVVADMTVKATYDILSYTVTFLDKDGAELDKQTVIYNQAATAPQAPAITGYTFTGWDKTFDHVQGDLMVQAQYEINTYTVIFQDWNTTVLSEQTIQHGATASAPTVGTRPGYTFLGWTPQNMVITENTTFIAQYSEDQYTVTFLDYDGTVLSTQVVTYGMRPTPPAEPTHQGMQFRKWDNNFDFITQNLTVTALYDADTYTVVFFDYDGTRIATETVAYGQAAPAPANPTRPDHTFMGWDIDFSNVTSNLQVYAQYRKDICQVIFRDWDNQILAVELVQYGSTPSAPQVNGRTGYHFTGWDTDFQIVHQDLDVKALYEIDIYTVTATTNNLQVAVVTPQNMTVEYLGTATFNALLLDQDYEFYQWSNGETSETVTITVTSDTTLTAYYRHRSFTVYEWLDDAVLCPGETYTFPSGKTYEITGDIALNDTVQFEYEPGVICDSIYEVMVYVWQQPTVPTTIVLPTAVYSRPLKLDDATQSITDALAQTQTNYTSDVLGGRWEWLQDDEWAEYLNETIWTKGDTLSMRYMIYTSCDDTLYTNVLTVPVLTPNADNCEDCQETAAVEVLYNWALILDKASLNKKGYRFTEKDVVWYRIVGELDNMDADETERDDEQVGTGFKYVSTTSLVGTGIYYAIIYLPEQTNDVPCLGNIRSNLVEVTEAQTAPSHKITVNPTLIQPSQTITVNGLDEMVESQISVFSANGQLIDTFTSQGTSQLDMTGAAGEGTYLIRVDADGKQTIVKYVVKQ